MSDIAFDKLEQAAEWFATLSAESVTADEKRQWNAWLDADEMHRKAWDRVKTVSQEFSFLSTESEQSRTLRALDVASKGRINRRRSLKMLVLMCSTGVIAWNGGRTDVAKQIWWKGVAEYSTKKGEICQIVLADGTKIWLNTLSAVESVFDDAWRRLNLRGGEVLVQTAKDINRPFLVDTSHGRLRAIGTRFSVRQMDAISMLSVFEGAVEIAPLQTEDRVIVKAGYEATFDDSRIDAIKPVNPTRQSWATGVLLADHMRLEDFVGELAQYQNGHLGCSPDVADLRISGAFPLREMDKTFAMLSAALPVQVKFILPWWGNVQAINRNEQKK